MISTSGEQAETVADIEAQNAKFSSVKKKKACSSPVFIVMLGLLTAFLLGAGFSYLMLKLLSTSTTTSA